MAHRWQVTAALAVALVGGVAGAARSDFVVGTPDPTFYRLPSETAEVKQALACFERRDYDQCLKLLQTAAARDPNAFPARLTLAKLFLRDKQRGPGRVQLELAAVEKPDLAETYLVFGQLALEEGRLTDAWLHFRRAAELAPADRGDQHYRRTVRADAQSGLALVAERRSLWKDAAVALRAVLDLDPSYGRARQRLGRALFRLGDVEQARKELEQAARDDVTLEPVASTLGQLYTEKGDLRQAEECLKEGVREAAKDPRVLRDYAGWLYERGRADEAKPQAEAAARLDGAAGQTRFLCGLIDLEVKDYAGAERLFRGLLAESPASFLASNHLAQALVEQSGDAPRRQALELAELNRRLYPDSAEALTTLGLVYWRHGRVADAEQVLRSALASGSATPLTAYVLARAQEARGARPDEIKPLVRRSLEASGPFRFREEARAWLAQLEKAP